MDTKKVRSLNMHDCVEAEFQKHNVDMDLYDEDLVVYNKYSTRVIVIFDDMSPNPYNYVAVVLERNLNESVPMWEAVRFEKYSGVDKDTVDFLQTINELLNY